MKDATETLRCIYCHRMLSWPMAQVWPSACLHCGRWPGAYTQAARIARGGAR